MPDCPSISTLPGTTIECSDANVSGVLALSFQSKNNANTGKSFPPRGSHCRLRRKCSGSHSHRSLTRKLHLKLLRKTIFAIKCHGMALSCASVIERFHHMIKNDVSLHNSVILLHMTAVLVDRSLYGKVWNYAASALTSHI